ncbi:MAG: hypothetical protein ACRCXT_03735 [Paraclostridium sp.]
MASLLDYGNSYNPSSDLAQISRESDKIKERFGLFFNKSEANIQTLSFFNRYRITVPGAVLKRGRGYIFMTRPDCNIKTFGGGSLNDGIKDQSFFKYLNNDNVLKSILPMLQLSYTAAPVFIPLITNIATGLDVPDVNIKTGNSVETFRGWKITYGKHGTESKTGIQFSLTLNDTNKLLGYNFIKAWTTYIETLDKGMCSRSSINKKFNILDYASSLYYIVVAEDGETILYWCKYTGVFPVKENNSAFSMSDEGEIQAPFKLNVDFVASFFESGNPDILTEFNKLSGGGSAAKQATYNNPENGYWTGLPFIEGSRSGYKLKFTNNSGGGISWLKRFNIF